MCKRCNCSTASAEDATPPLSPNPPPTGCEVVGACYMIWSMLSRGEQGECLGSRTQSQWDEKTKVSWCWVSYPCNSTDCLHLTWIKHPVCLSGSSLDRCFIWGQWRTTCPLCQCFYAPAACWCAYAEEGWTWGGLLQEGCSELLRGSPSTLPWKLPLLLTSSAEVQLTFASVAWPGHHVRVWPVDTTVQL